jgi:hypothetical protein
MKPDTRIVHSAALFQADRQAADPFVFLTVVSDALRNADVICPFCSVKMISRTGLVAGLCPACFEERCATCGAEVIQENGELAPGLAIGRGGSWKCAKCAGTLPQARTAKRRRKKTP